MLMKHDVNGYKDATGDEVATMKKNGWYEYSYEQLAQDVAKKQQKVYNAGQPVGETDGNVATPSGEETPIRRKWSRKPKGE